MALNPAEPRLPVTIVTGFLGSGKTTLVNHILANQAGLRVAVMVNEIGEIAIDNDLVIGAADDLIELANGCICCSINNDLLDAAFRVLRRTPRVDYLIVETTGLADPLPVALSFLRSELRDQVRVDSIVALADAANFSLERFANKAALNQLRFADFVVLNKCDLAGPERANAVADAIRDLAGSPARVMRATRAQVALPLILGTGVFRAEFGPDPDTHDHIEADGFEAVSFASDRAFSAERFQQFLEDLPANVFRAKGILSIEGSSGRHLFHLVGRRFTLDEAPGAIAGPNRLVLIGQDLDGGKLRAQLRACLVTSVIPGPE
jgi:G3E family GTPase